MLDALRLDQLRILVTVIDAGSFSAAARRLRRAQSAVSYAIASLEDALGVTLFDRTGWRPRLTEAGAALSADARTVLLNAEGIKARAKALRDGLETEVPIVAEVMFSTRTIVSLVDAFQRRFPTVTLNMHIQSLGGAPEMVLSGGCRVGIVCSLTGIPPGLECRPLKPVPLEVVAAASHPLAALRGLVSASLLDKYVQVVLADRDSLIEGRSFAIVSTRYLRTADLGWKHAMLRAGVGWGYMPRELVEDDIASDRLAVLALENRPPDTLNMPVSLVYRQGDFLGPAGRWMVEWLTADHSRVGQGAASATPNFSARKRTERIHDKGQSRSRLRPRARSKP